MRTGSRLRIDLTEERVWDGDRVLPLAPKPFAMLRYFVLNPNRLLTRDQILTEVWSKAHVSPGLVREYVGDLRRALGDTPDRQGLIETDRGRGYRYLGGIEVVGRAYGDTRAESWQTAVPGVIVLPFAMLGAGAASPGLGERVTADVATKLHRTRLFNVISGRPNGRSGTAGDAEREELLSRARFAVDGSVQRVGELARVVVRLLDTTQERLLWSDSFDGEPGASLDGIDEITSRIVDHLLGVHRAIVNADGKHRIERNAEDLDVSDYLSCGFFHFHRIARDANARALRMFERAAELAPENASVSQALAWGWSQRSRFAWGDEPSKDLQVAYEMSQRAVSLDETDFENHWVLGLVSLLRRDYESADTQFERALQLGPDVPHLIADAGDFLVYMGRPRDAIREVERAMRLNPYFPGW